MASSSTIVFVSDKQSRDTGAAYIADTMYQSISSRYNWFVMANDAVTSGRDRTGVPSAIVSLQPEFPLAGYFSFLVSLPCSCQRRGILQLIFSCFHRQGWEYRKLVHIVGTMPPGERCWRTREVVSAESSRRGRKKSHRVRNFYERNSRELMRMKFWK